MMEPGGIETADSASADKQNMDRLRFATMKYVISVSSVRESCFSQVTYLELDDIFRCCVLVSEAIWAENTRP